jgi:sodium pump decarboxylase gamma subunit
LSDILQGVILLVVGMTVLFAAMALLILAMVVLERLFRTRPLVPDEEVLEETETVSRLARDTADEEIVAAIALALAHLRSLDISRSGLGAALEAGHGSWWTMGQIQQQPMNVISSRKASSPKGTLHTT